MKNNLVMLFVYRSFFFKLFFLSPLLMFICGCPGNWKNELGVYTLCAYESNWKGNVCVDHAHDPYYDFWDVMNCGTSSECAHSSSRRRVNPVGRP